MSASADEAGAAEDEGIPTSTRRKHIVRLALFAVFLLTLFYFVAVRRVVDIEEVRDVIAKAGPVAPLVYIPISVQVRFIGK